MNYEVIVDVLDAIAFSFVTPELLGGKIQGARLRVSESRLSYLVRRGVLLFIKPEAILNKSATPDDVEKHWREVWRSDATSLNDGPQGLVMIGGGLGWLALAYWLWDWLWQWAKVLMLCFGALGVIVGLPLLFVVFDRWLRSHELTFSAFWVGAGLFAIARAVSVAFHLKLIGHVIH